LGIVVFETFIVDNSSSKQPPTTSVFLTGLLQALPMYTTDPAKATISAGISGRLTWPEWDDIPKRLAAKSSEG
jgi:hypothetical protein